MYMELPNSMKKVLVKNENLWNDLKLVVLGFVFSNIARELYMTVQNVKKSFVSICLWSPICVIVNTSFHN